MLSRARGSSATNRAGYQRIAPLSITPCSAGAVPPMASRRVASRLTSKPGSFGTTEVSRQPMRQSRAASENPNPRLGVPVNRSPNRASPVAALVLVADPARRAPVDPALVKAALGLTATQSQIAAMLAAGQSTRDIARATGRTQGTVRWHLKQIYARQGISRQAQVVELVLSLSSVDGFDH